jgi:sugar lactone lactonase YvrE
VFAADTQGVSGLAFGPADRLYACGGGSRRIVAYDPSAQRSVVIANANGSDLVVLPDGSGYYTDPDNKKVWHFTPAGQQTSVDDGIPSPSGIAVSPDHTLLTVADKAGRFTWSFQVQQPQGALVHKQQYGYLHVPDETITSSSGETILSGADGMAVDSEGRLYVATRVGLQVLDQPGRVHLILRKPNDGWLGDVVFGGSARDTLYVRCGDGIYKRRVKAQGVNSWQPPVTPPKPQL